MGQPLHDGRTILLVEDDDLIRANTAETLQDAGFVVVHAVTAEEAMTALQTAQIDVLVTDLNLPGESGVELAGRARQLRPNCRSSSRPAMAAWRRRRRTWMPRC